MQDADRTRDKGALLQLHDKILPALAQSIHQQLADIIPLFHNFQLERVVDTWTKGPDASDSTPISIEKVNVQQMFLRLRLEGFQNPNVPSFDISKELLFKLWQYGYEVGPGQDNIWKEKEYYQPWNESEIREITQRWCAELIDEITQRLESLM